MPRSERDDRRRIAALTGVAMIAFAANSVLCRAALGEGRIDAASFTFVRLAAGAVVLASLVAWRSGWRSLAKGDFRAAVLLFVYAGPFAFAYEELDAASGALVLFGAVQATMLAVALFRGERPRPLQWIGLLCAIGGLVFLLLPTAGAPSLAGGALMLVAGVGWGSYSLLGRGAVDPLSLTAANFVRSVPLALVPLVVFSRGAHVETQGLVLALASGGLASGLGYAIWYAALPGLTATAAASVQLSVPIIAAAGGVVLLGERLAPRFPIAAILVLGGIALALGLVRLRRPGRSVTP